MAGEIASSLRGAEWPEKNLGSPSTVPISFSKETAFARNVERPEQPNSQYNLNAVALSESLLSPEVAMRQISILVFALVVMSGVVALALAGEKTIDKAKLVGKWKLVMIDGKVPPVDSIFEFKKDGNLIITFAKDGESRKVESTYSIEGEKITVVVKKAGGDDKNTEKISLDGDKLVITKSDGNKSEFERIK
ncbi:MAG TPA: lipocalin family protein [Gemmataceae bacterium]|nr:lipocalin family protein [Gemmataceae bacterium]